jgi:hypothetical protein
MASQGKVGGQTNYAQNLARSMTIDEMRELHRRALSEAEAKQTELRLVLASRYRELVGSSDEVTKMRERAQELHELVHALPGLMEKLVSSTTEQQSQVSSTREDSKAIDPSDSAEVLVLRHKLSNLPRIVHRALDKNDVHEAAESLMQLFRLIAEQTEEYPLANALASGVNCNPPAQMDDLLRAQMRMTFLHVQTLPAKITRISKHILSSAASFGSSTSDPKYGAQMSASALSTLDLFDITQGRDRPVQLLDLYFDSKAQLLQGLLGQLTTAVSAKDKSSGDTDASNAEAILSKIVLILQYDIVLHPYQIFVLRKFAACPDSISNPSDIIKSLPMFPASVVQSKASNFLSAHLPLIRTKVKSVLMDIAGTTASALGKIRQSLYDKTDGVDCMERLDSNGVCTWEEAVSGVVDVPSVLSSSHGAGGPLPFSPSSRESLATDRKLSLWSALFSNTFSSLVHSLLTTSFQSVHKKVVSALRLSLANAPPSVSMLPHEAYRNTLYIASELDTALLKVSDDAHELLVHAEERVESETRLRQSLYVQTCEIMGRLICELRRMLLVSDSSDAVKELIVGRLCHLLKFRLTALPTLLDPDSSPAVLHGTSGMISLLELSSAFDLADDNDDGLITFQEAMEAVDSAFSGTQFHGAELVRETLLLAATGDNDRSTNIAGTGARSTTPQDVTLNELTLLLARGLRHESSGQRSALGIIQESLDTIVTSCFDKWAVEALSPHTATLSIQTKDFVQTASTCSETEYQRVYAHAVDPGSISLTGGAAVNNVSPHVIDFLLQVAFALNRSVCPSDSLEPVPSTEYAASMGIDTSNDIPCLMTTIRWALLSQGLAGIVAVMTKHVAEGLGSSEISLRNCGPSGLVQLKSDLSFVGKSFFRRNRYGFGKSGTEKASEVSLRKVSKEVDALVRRSCDKSVLAMIEENHNRIMEACDLYFSSLFGQDDQMSVPLGDLGGAAAPRAGNNPLLYSPLASSCRFPLLPIQTDRTLSGVQARGKYKEKEESEARRDNVGGGAVRAGLGFFSSMLKKT